MFKTKHRSVKLQLWLKLVRNPAIQGWDPPRWPLWPLNPRLEWSRTSKTGRSNRCSWARALLVWCQCRRLAWLGRFCFLDRLVKLKYRILQLANWCKVQPQQLTKWVTNHQHKLPLTVVRAIIEKTRLVRARKRQLVVVRWGWDRRRLGRQMWTEVPSLMTLIVRWWLVRNVVAREANQTGSASSHSFLLQAALRTNSTSQWLSHAARPTTRSMSTNLARRSSLTFQSLHPTLYPLQTLKHHLSPKQPIPRHPLWSHHSNWVSKSTNSDCAWKKLVIS